MRLFYGKLYCSNEYEFLLENSTFCKCNVEDLYRHTEIFVYNPQILTFSVNLHVYVDYNYNDKENSKIIFKQQLHKNI